MKLAWLFVAMLTACTNLDLAIASPENTFAKDLSVLDDDLAQWKKELQDLGTPSMSSAGAESINSFESIDEVDTMVDKVVSTFDQAVEDDSEIEQEEAIAPEKIHAIPGSRLNISVYREEDLTGLYVVNEDGYINFPLIEKIKAGGKDAETIREDLTLALKEIIIDPQVSVTLDFEAEVKALTSVTVLGDVKESGTYDITRGITLTKLIALAGGFGVDADTEQIKIIRAHKKTGKAVVTSVNLEDINTGMREDPVIEFSDKVIVSRKEADIDGAAILGQVNRPGLFSVTENLTLIRLIANAGGFTDLADTGKIRIIRVVNGKQQVTVHNAARMLTGDQVDPQIQPLDKVYVPESFF